MQSKQIEVSCPCCGTILLVDTLTAQVLRRTRAAEQGAPGVAEGESARWEEAQEHVRERRRGGEEKFDAALSQERDHEKALDDLFEQAKRRALGQEPPPEGSP